VEEIEIKMLKLNIKMRIKNKKNYLRINLLKIVIVFFLLILPLTLFVFFTHQNKKKPSTNSNIKKENKKTIINEKAPTNTLTFSIKNSFYSKKMFFTFKVEHIDLKNKIVYIFLEADNDFATSDAVDLELEKDDNIEVKKIIPGDSFDSYPRKNVDKNTIIITGVALSPNGKIKMAKPQSIFIKIFLSLKNPQKKSSFTLNQKKTKIFFYGEDITNTQKSFKKINFN
jgi:hypothetical protein